MKKRFKDEYWKIEPDKLIDKNKNNKTESFFLGLGAVFNDLEGLFFFEKMLVDNYEKPRNGEVSGHVGYYAGVMVQIQKLIISTVNEFFDFLKKNNDIFKEADFKVIINRLSKSDQRLWYDLVDGANGKFKKATELLKSIRQIRNSIGFHYNWSGKDYRRGYENRFFGEAKDPKSEFACYVLGDAVEDTRFFFVDAIVEESLHLAAGKKPGESSIGNVTLEEFKQQVIGTIVLINDIIRKILKNYIQHRRNS